MNWNELKAVWERQPTDGWSAAEVARLERTFAEKRRAMARRLFWRDVTEAAAGLAVAVVFARAGWAMGRSGWPIAVAVLLMLGLSGFFVAERVRVRRERVGPDAPLLTKLNAEIAEQERQRRLLSNVGSWYVAPIAAAGAIFVGTAVVAIPLPVEAKLFVGAIGAAILGLTAWGVVALNRSAVRRTIAPRLAELERWRDVLSAR